MTEKPTTPAYKLVACGRCRQPVGAQCKTLTTGRTTETHSVRYLDAGFPAGHWITKETKELSVHVSFT